MSNQETDHSADGGSARYGKGSSAKGSGHQESKKPERKEERGFKSRQGGSQNRADPDAGARRGHDDGDAGGADDERKGGG